MRKFTFLLALFISFTSYAQTVVSYREAPLNGGAPYFLNGTAFIEELSDGTFRFRLDNAYSTNSGPDVQIFMTNDNNFTSPINTSGALFVEDVGTLDGISQFSGAYSRILPGVTALADFDFVVFTCFQFGMLHWGNGTFSAPIIPCAETTSSIIETACGSYTGPSGKIFTTTGIVNDTILNSAGCDSVIAIDLTINMVDVNTTMIDSVVTASAVGAGYQWINCTTNTPIVGAINQSYTITDDDSYAVVVTEGSCLDTSSCVNFVITGIEEDNFGENINLYPNPTSNDAIVDLGTLTGVNIFIIDITGKRVYSNENETRNQIVLDTSSFDKGLYFVTIQNDDQTRVLKLIKQ